METRPGLIASGFRVLPTDVAQRKRAHGDYIVAVSSGTHSRLGQPTYAVVTSCAQYRGEEQALRVLCRVVSDTETEDGDVRLDQTLRNALGIAYEYDAERVRVEVVALNISLVRRLARWMAELLGGRYMVLRVGKSDVGDIEKELVRVHGDLFPLLGCSSSSHVIVESVRGDASGALSLSKKSVRAYEWTDELGARRKLAQKPGFGQRYPHPEETLGVDPDIGSIYMDAFAREELGVRPLSCVRVRRDVWHAFLNECREFGVVFFISLFGIALVAPVKQMTWSVAAVIVGIGLAIAILLTVINLRARGSA